MEHDGSSFNLLADAGWQKKAILPTGPTRTQVYCVNAGFARMRACKVLQGRKTGLRARQ